MSGLLQIKIQIQKSLLTQENKKQECQCGQSDVAFAIEGKKMCGLLQIQIQISLLTPEKEQECQCGQSDMAFANIEGKNVRFATCRYKYKYKKSLLTPEK